MAVSMASLGGIGIVHSNNSAIEQAGLVEFAKAHRIPFVSDCVFYSPNDHIQSVDEFGDSPCVFITENGSRNSKLVGVVNKFDWEKRADKRDARVSDYMVESVVNVPSSYNFDDVAGYLAAKNLEYVPLVKNGEVIDLVSVGDVERVRGFPKTGALPSLGKNGEFLVGASIGTRESDKERLEHLVKAGADVIVLDSSQGNSIYQIEMIKYVKRMYPELELIGGNVVTMAQAQNLIQAGVDGLRVGMGSGSICTTQEVCAVGRGQVIDYIVEL